MFFGLMKLKLSELRQCVTDFTFNRQTGGDDKLNVLRRATTF